ncbi:hypothetical protein ACQUQU_01995 [Thalassolituus sp. LLYu03]|uniref:hypothetical protein n=1 Tax=Thalassolituus sp. LLYu03 TaxID=3421656 RepID=UPI003D2C5104
MGWFGRRQQQAADHRGCLGIELHRGRAFAVLSGDDGIRQTYTPGADEQGLGGLEQWLREQQLAGVPVVISLDTLDYQLHLVEAPPVPDDELADAIRFRLRDLIPASRDDLLVQAMRLPADAYRGRMDMAYAAVVERPVIGELVRWCRHQHLQLDSITIPELSLLQLVAEYEPESAIGVLRLDDHEGVIYLYRDGALYLTRKLNIGVKALLSVPDAQGFSLDTGSQTDALALEIQRSLDYFDSQLGMGMVSEIWMLTPDGDDLSEQLPVLEASINTPVRPLSPEQFNRAGDEPLTASLTMALGNALVYRRGQAQ